MEPGMDNTSDGVNGTSITPDKNWAVLAVLPIVFFVAMGNILVILAVKMDHKLRSSTNYFLTSLAVADLLVAITVMPPSLAMIINDYNWPFPDEMCGIWIMLDVCFSTSSILHLCMISLDRYLALAKPFQYSNGGWLSKNSSGGWSTDKRGNSKWRGGTGHGGGNAKMTKRVMKRIVLVWATSLGIALPLPILGSQDKSKIFYGKFCVINIPQYTIYGSLVAFFLPLIIMFITYSLTIRTLQKQSKFVKCVMGKDGSSHRGRPSVTSSVSSRYMPSRSSTGSTKTFLGKRVSSLTAEDPSLPDILCATDNGHKALKQQQTSCRNSGASRISFKVSYTEGKIKTCALLCCVCVSSKQRSVDHEKDLDSATMDCDYDQKVKNVDNKSDSDASETSSLNQHIVSRSPMLARANMKLSKVVSKLPLNRVSTRRISASVKSRAIATEQRASKVLGMIFILFCIFWCPFFITNFFSGLCELQYLSCDNDMELMNKLMKWFVWVGYVSSGVNPCVYTLFSKQFRETFRKLIYCQCSKIGQGKLYRSYPRDGTTGGFSTSSFHHDFQHSMERDALRCDSLGRNTLTVRQTNDRPLRTFGESVVVRQHRRSQVTQSGDSSMALFNVDEDKQERRSKSPTNERLQWRSSWHCMLNADNTSNDNSAKDGDNPQHYKLRGGQWTDYQKRRYFSDPDSDRKGKLVLQDSIPEDDLGEEMDLRAAGIARSFTFGGSSELGERQKLNPKLRPDDEARATFRCGFSDEEDEDNNNIGEVYLDDKETENSQGLPSTSRGASCHPETGVRLSSQLRCKACGANMKHTRDDSRSEQSVEQAYNLLDVFEIADPVPRNSQRVRNTLRTDCNKSSHPRQKRTRQLSRFDSGVGESVRNSDSF